MSEFSEIVAEAEELKSQYTGRTELFDEMEAMYFIESRDSAKYARMAENVKLTYSPNAANKLDGAVRLLVASDPKIKVPSQDSISAVDRDSIETFANAMWGGSGEITGTPAHYDAILSGLLYGETHMGIISMRKIAKLSAGKAQQKLAEQSARITPYLYETWSPRTCYARHNRLGLTGHYREVELTASQVRLDWGTAADGALGNKTGKSKVTYCEWWDLEKQAVWIRGGKTPIVFQNHELPFIPIVHTLTEGSTALFDEPRKQLRPFLYKLAKSGLWNRENLLLTTLFTMIFAIGGNPLFIYKRNDPNKDVEVDWTTPGGRVLIQNNEDFYALSKNVIDPSIMQGMQKTSELITDSTIYEQALGKALGANSPYSLNAMLSQSGRLPLISPQARLSWMIAKALWISFQWMRESGESGSRTARYGKISKIDPAIIPDDLDITVNLTIDLPQDRLGMANIANILNQSGLVSQEWIRGEILNVENDAAMAKQVLKEKIFSLLEQFTGERMITGAAATPGNATRYAAPAESNAPDDSGQFQGMSPEMLAAGGGEPMPIPGTPPENGVITP